MRKGFWWGNRKPSRGQWSPAGSPMSLGAGMAAAALAFAAVLSGCMEGGSDGIENPKVELQFQGPDGGAAGSGMLKVYAGDYNPIEDSTPLLEKSFSGGAVVDVTAEEMDAWLKARLGNPASLPDTQIQFNVVAVSGDREAFVAGFRYRREGDKVTFALQAVKDAPAFGPLVKTQVKLEDAVFGFQGAVGGAGISFGIDYVYIPGSPYHAAVGGDLPDGRKGGFKFARMSRGSYTGLIGADQDSATFYQSDDTLDTGDPEFSASTWEVITIIDR